MVGEAAVRRDAHPSSYWWVGSLLPPRGLWRNGQSLRVRYARLERVGRAVPSNFAQASGRQVRLTSTASSGAEPLPKSRARRGTSGGLCFGDPKATHLYGDRTMTNRPMSCIRG
jgi:hypothetical protein